MLLKIETILNKLHKNLLTLKKCYEIICPSDFFLSSFIPNTNILVLIADILSFVVFFTVFMVILKCSKYTGLLFTYNARLNTDYSEYKRITTSLPQ